jgi:hypothetical protein
VSARAICPSVGADGVFLARNRVFLPALALLTADDPEKAHEIAVKVIGSALVPVDRGVDDERLALEVSLEQALVVVAWYAQLYGQLETGRGMIGCVSSALRSRARSDGRCD